MHIKAFKLRPLLPPKDNLLRALQESKLKLAEGDIVAIASKVVSINEGRSVSFAAHDKKELIQREADLFFIPPRSKYRRIFTIARGALVGSAGIDESNGADHFILYPKDPFQSARRLRRALMRIYQIKKLGLIITDSMSLPLRRGAVGFALAWDGFDPLRDYRGTKDLFGRAFTIEMANLADSLAASAVLSMGEGKEQRPVAIIRNAPNIVFINRPTNKDGLMVPTEDDLFAPLLFQGRKWRKP